MRLAFMGTPEFAVASLNEIIAQGHEVVAVYTQPPAPKGRGQVLTPSPVHQFAENLGLLVRTPKSMKDDAAIAEFCELDIDACVVVAYGQILKKAVLDHPPLGCFNLHGSLLPRWRGAAPIQRAIMAGDDHTGVEIMRMTEGLDEGDVLLSARVDIHADDTAQTLHDRMAVAGAALWPVALAALDRGGAVFRPQLGEATYAKKITPQEARIDWSRAAKTLDCHIRGLSPFPGAWCEMPSPKGPTRLKILLSTLGSAKGNIGEIISLSPFEVGTGEGSIRILRMQREGKAAQTADEFIKGAGLKVGDYLN